MFESVVLPAPFSPRSACTSPAAASKLTSSFATTPGNRFVIPAMRRRERRGAGRAGASLLRRCGGLLPHRLARRRDRRDLPDDTLDEPLHRVEVRRTLSVFPAGTTILPF